MAFHPYPQVIQLLCNAGRFGPPVRITGPSACPWVAHPVSGLLRATGARFRLAFAPAPRLPALNLATHSNSPAHSSIGTPAPRLHAAVTACRHAVSGTVSLPSRGAFHLSLTVLVHYRSAQVFSLGLWSAPLPTGLPLARGTQEAVASLRASPTGLSPLSSAVPGPFGCTSVAHWPPSKADDPSNPGRSVPPPV